ncbi:MAG TPA: hypothetical protein VJV78_15230 [Polyangiales bacterium]|nr:hypothetical protein [Polyangiales bacterium]
MLKAFIKNRLDAMERDLQYDMSYAREMLDIDLGGFMRFFRATRLSAYKRDLPLDVGYAVGLVAVMTEDCGPCSQLLITMAEREGISSETLRAVARGDTAAMSSDVRLGVQFTRAVLAHDLRADELRDQVIARWGKRGLLTMAFAMVSARLYPTVKYALGYGKACSRLQIAGEPVAVNQTAAA